tara:strand:- start:495 stop:659 length:165 start_codon:yes stop_codon:yes gene_type:complete
MGKDFAKEQRERMQRLQNLYVLDGRHRPEHPQHGLYTGLAAKAEEIEKTLLDET